MECWRVARGGERDRAPAKDGEKKREEKINYRQRTGEALGLQNNKYKGGTTGGGGKKERGGRRDSADRLGRNRMVRAAAAARK